jgi:DNA modification methylase
MTAVSFDHKIEIISISQLKPYPRNARRHSKGQIKQIAKSIETFGFTNPVLTGSGGQILAGHGRVEAARLLGMETVPTIPLAHLTEAEKRAYVLADNKLALNANWDQDMLAIELQGLIGLEFDVELTGFSIAETDVVIEGAKSRDTKGKDSNLDEVPPLLSRAVTVRGDLWQLGYHRLVCGDARASADFALLLSGEKSDLVFTDPPYNVKIDGNVGGLGNIKHREFAFASGEMTEVQFTAFLALTLKNCATHAADGAIAFVCMDWRHMRELLDAGTQAFTELKNLCVWNKTNGGMGTFYRSKHELVFVYKVGTAPHTNSFELGQSGRYRTNVWNYAGISSLGATRANELAMHPTVKPVALIADAIKDFSKRGEIILDCFGGSGSTLIAAETTGRKARLIEYDPIYCDTIIRRWQNITGKEASLVSNGQSFEDVSDLREGSKLS